MPAGTRKAALAGCRSWKLQEFGEHCGTGMMHGRAHRHLDGFQVETAGLVAAIEDRA
jgi:hypothetical protein